MNKANGFSLEGGEPGSPLKPALNNAQTWIPVATALRVINSLKAGVVSLIGAVGELFEGLIISSAQAARGWEAPSGMGTVWSSRMVLGSPLPLEPGGLQGHHGCRAGKSQAQRLCHRAVSSRVPGCRNPFATVLRSEESRSFY